MKFKNLILSVLLVVVINSFPIDGFSENSFVMTYQSINNGETNVELTPELYFEFNHRLDPCDNIFTINGSSDLVSDFEIKGTSLRIFVNGALGASTSYTLSLETVSDLYSNPSPVKSITFTTRDEYVTLCDDFEGGADSLAQNWYTNTFGYSGEGKMGIYTDPTNSSNNALLLDANTAQARIENPKYDSDGDGIGDYCAPGKAIIDFRIMFESYEKMVGTLTFVHVLSKPDLKSDSSVSNSSLVRFSPKSGTDGGTISFANGSGYTDSGFGFTYGTWHRITISLDLYSNTMKCYVDGQPVKDDISQKVFELKNPVGNARLIYNIQFKNNTVSNGKGSKIWLDDVTVAPIFKISNSGFYGSDNNWISQIDNIKTCYNATIESTNPFGEEELTLFAALYDSDEKILLGSKMINLKLSPFEKQKVSIGFESVPEDSKIKIFYRRTKNDLTEISNITKNSVVRFP